MQIYDLYHWSLILGSCVQICILNMRPKNSDEQSHFENTVLAEEKKSNIFFFFFCQCQGRVLYSELGTIQDFLILNLITSFDHLNHYIHVPHEKIEAQRESWVTQCQMQLVNAEQEFKHRSVWISQCRGTLRSNNQDSKILGNGT